MTSSQALYNGVLLWRNTNLYPSERAVVSSTINGNWKLENVMSLKVQPDQLEAIEAASADNVQMRITSTVSWCAALRSRPAPPTCPHLLFGVRAPG